MSLRRTALALVVGLVNIVAATGCGIGPGEAAGGGEATLTVTRDYGAERVLDAAFAGAGESETVIRVLDREAEIKTRYGGGFVQSIEGISGGMEEGRSLDWFFYVNGSESPVGAAEASVEPGDRIWWDHHDWTDVARVPAVVGSFPQPFAAAYEGDGDPIAVGCAAAESTCETARDALEREGIGAEVIDASQAEPSERPRVLVGELDDLAADRVAGLLLEGPEHSGVFTRPAGGGSGLELLDERLEVRRSDDLGLVAAMAAVALAPTWVVTGTDAELVAAAAELLEEGLLQDRFALAVTRDGETIAVP